MSTRTPIAPSEIRVGDRVAAVSHGMETTFVVDHFDSGRIYASAGNADHDSEAFLRGDKNEWFLLNRPTPPIELPTEATLGWLTYGNSEKAFGKFRAGDIAEADCAIDCDAPIAIESGASGRKVNAMYRVTAFTPATAVPTEALDALRAVREAWGPCFLNDDQKAIRAFIEAVTEATA